MQKFNSMITFCQFFTPAFLILLSSGLSLAQDTEADLEKGSIEGTVVLKSDQIPVANAEVRLMSLSPSMGIQRVTIDTEKTSESGSFKFENLAPGNYRIRAFSNGLMSREKRYQGFNVSVDELGEASVNPKLELLPGNRLNVLVKSKATGEPIKEARVRLTWTDTERDHFTDAEGKVEILGLTSEVWNIETVATGHAEEEQAVSLNPQELITEVKVELSEGGGIAGRVTDKSGQPLPEVGISVFLASHRGGQIEYMKTDEKGNYEFPYLPLSELELSYSKDDYVSLKQTIILPPHEKKKKLNATLEQRPYGGGILATIVDELGKPIAGATISNHGRSSRDVREGKTDKKGNCLLENMFTGSAGHEITVKAKGFVPIRQSCQPGPKDAPTKLKIVLEKGHTLRGQVLLAEDVPAKGLLVFFANGENGFSGIGGRTKTDQQGRFQLDSLPKPCTFTFYPPAGYSQINDLELEVDSEQEMIIRLEQSAAVRGRVINSKTGKPVPAFKVRLTFCRERQPGDPTLKSMPGRLNDPGTKFASSKGEFEIPGLKQACPFQATIEAPGYEKLIVSRILAINDDGEAPVIELSQMDPSDYLQLAGRLCDQRGKPMRSVQIRLVATPAKMKPVQLNRFPLNWSMIESGQVEQRPECLQFLSTTTDKIGLFRLPNVKKGVTLSLYYWGGDSAPGRVADLAEVVSDLTAFEVTTVAPAAISIKIDRKLFPDASSLTIHSEYGYKIVTLKPGIDEYKLDGLAPTKHSISIQGKRQRTDNNSLKIDTLVSKSVELNSSFTEEIEFNERE